MGHVLRIANMDFRKFNAGLFHKLPEPRFLGARKNKNCIRIHFPKPHHRSESVKIRIDVSSNHFHTYMITHRVLRCFARVLQSLLSEMRDGPPQILVIYLLNLERRISADRSGIDRTLLKSRRGSVGTNYPEIQAESLWYCL